MNKNINTDDAVINEMIENPKIRDWIKKINGKAAIIIKGNETKENKKERFSK